MIKKIFITIGVLLLVSYLAIAGVVYRMGNPPAKYRGVEVNILDSTQQAFVSIADIRQQLRTAKLNPVGKLIDSVNTIEIERAIESNKLIRKAYCYHTPDSTLRIDIEQRHPILRVKSSTHGDFYVDEEREIMPFQNVVAMHIPLATGMISKEKASSELYDVAKFIIENRFWRQEITQINVNQKGEIELVPRVGSHTILLGSAKDIDKKLARVRKFYDKVLPRKGWNYYKVLNVKFDNQVVGEK